ncbi:MAG: hypothetical protein E7111_08300 [Bacteroidales bacterium]|nr:hypothetical protein [Bacteroidales bacterium]
MKKIYKYLLIIAIFFPVAAGAQVLKGSYFLDHSVNNHRMNPAFVPRSNYFQALCLGYVGSGIYSNLDVPLLLQPVDGKLGTFLHPSVSVKDFERQLPSHLHLDTELETTLLSFGGFTKKKSFWNFSVDIKANVDVDLPSDLFLFMKKGVGTQADKYNIGNVNAYMGVSAQAAFGYSREWFKGFRGGFKVRGIVPLAYAGLNLEDMSLETGADRWTIRTDGNLHIAANGVKMNQSEANSFPSPEFDPNKFLGSKIVAGWGASVDLGVEYTLEIGCPVDGMAFSLAVTDLGVMSYSKDALMSYTNKGRVDWTGFQLDENLDLNVKEAIDDLANNAKGLLNIKEVASDKGLVRTTMPRLYAGVELPFLKRSMSVGLLYSARFSHSYARHELTASYNITPCKWFALGLNYSFLNTTRSMGAVLELTPKWGPCLFVGVDYFPMEWINAPILEDILGESPGLLNMIGIKTTSWAVPMSSRFNLNFGIAMNLGSKHLNPKKEIKEKKNSNKNN